MVEHRGRRSVADLSVVTVVGLEERPSPPIDMSDDEKRIWMEIVGAMQTRYFGKETFPNLRSLCRHTVATDRLWQLYSKALTSGKKPEIIEQLSCMHNRESAAVRRLSADLRLAKSVRSQPVVIERQKQNQSTKPWDDGW